MSGLPRRPRRRIPVFVLALPLLLAACGTAPTGTAPEPAGPAPVPAPPAPTAPDANWLSDFERQQVALAQSAESRGQWAAALLNWEVLTLVKPEEASYQARWTETRRTIAARVAERAAAAEAAQRRGDAEAASRLWLDVLALDPGHARAADALRQMERERTRRASTGRFARSPGMAEIGEPGRSSNSVREHASMLAQQGDVDGAIGLLRDAPGLRTDARLRGQLADLYVQKAEALRQRQPDAARAAVDAALALDRRHPAALALQQQLPPPRPRAAPGAAPAAPGR